MTKWQRKAPSMKALARIPAVNRHAALLIRKVIHGTLAPETASMACKVWVARCYWEPGQDEKIMEALNELSNGFGTCVIRDARRSLAHSERIEYVNQGDTYAATILHDPLNDRWWVGCWGDVAERMGDNLL